MLIKGDYREDLMMRLKHAYLFFSKDVILLFNSYLKLSKSEKEIGIYENLNLH